VKADIGSPLTTIGAEVVVLSVSGDPGIDTSSWLVGNEGFEESEEPEQAEVTHARRTRTEMLVAFM